MLKLQWARLDCWESKGIQHLFTFVFVELWVWILRFLKWKSPAKGQENYYGAMATGKKPEVLSFESRFSLGQRGVLLQAQAWKRDEIESKY